MNECNWAGHGARKWTSCTHEFLNREAGLRDGISIPIGKPRSVRDLVTARGAVMVM